MSINTYVQGLKPKTNEYQIKLDIFISCKKLNIEPPKEIKDFFYDWEICEEGIVTELPKESVREYTDEYRDFLEVDLTKIPKDISKIRFVNSY